MARDFDIRHLQIGKRVPQNCSFFRRQVPARLFLNHLELIDEHLGQLQVYFALSRFWIWNLTQKQGGILRLHHDKLDEALGKFSADGAGLSFAGHIYLDFAAAGLFGLPGVFAVTGGRTVAKTYG